MKIIVLLAFILAITFSSCNNSKEKKTESKTDTTTVVPDTATPANTDSNTPTESSPVTDYSYEPSVSVISGTIKTEMVYGAPGFGENPKTDKKVEMWVVQLDRGINVIAPKTEDGPETVNNITKIQLISPESMPFTSYKDKKVKLTGTFFAPHTAHHRTDVMMDVQKIE